MSTSEDKIKVKIISGSEEEIGFENLDDVLLRKDRILSEFNTPEAKYEARLNLDSQVIDQDEY